MLIDPIDFLLLYESDELRLTVCVFQVKLKSMRHQEERVENLYSSRHQRHVASDSELLTNVMSFYDDWSTARLRIGK